MQNVRPGPSVGGSRRRESTLKALARCQSRRWWAAACPPPHATDSPAPHAHLCAEPRRPLPLLVLCVPNGEDEEIFRGNHLLWAGVREIPLGVKNLGIWLCCDSHSDTHVDCEYRDLATAGAIMQYCRDRGLPPRPRPPSPGHEGGGDGRQQAPPFHSSKIKFPRPSESFLSTNHFILKMVDLRERERETSICCSTYGRIHGLILV